MKARGALWRGTERQKEKGRRKKSFFLMVFLGFEVGCSLESEFEFAAEFIAVGKIELVFLDEELAIHLIGGVFDKQFVFVAGEDDADGRVVAFGVFLGGEVAEVEIRKAEGSAPWRA
jgi:hypothetical protein